MRYVRFMTKRELKEFQSGEVVQGMIDSEFIFLEDTITPEEMIVYIPCIVNLDYVVVFKHIGKDTLKESTGIYINQEYVKPKNLIEKIFNHPEIRCFQEYRTNIYSQETMRIVKIGKLTGTPVKVEWKKIRR